MKNITANFRPGDPNVEISCAELTICEMKAFIKQIASIATGDIKPVRIRPMLVVEDAQIISEAETAS